jgi:uncharacterized protein (UPF0335 family)
MNPQTMNGEELLSFIQRIERIEEEEAALKADKKEIYSEAKSAGYDPKYVKLMIKLRKMDQDEIDETDELTKMYKKAIGLK